MTCRSNRVRHRRDHFLAGPRILQGIATSRRPAWRTMSVMAFILVLPGVAFGKKPPPDLDRCVGHYAMGRAGASIHVAREEDHLIASASGQPAAMLVPDKKPGRFQMRGTPIEVQFVADDSGRITRLDLIAPNGRVVSHPRLRDNSAVLDSVRATAVNADTAVNARVFNGYERKRDAAGMFHSETYVFGEGGFRSTDPTNNPSLHDMNFDQLALMLAPGLAKEGYVTGRDVHETDLLIMVYWGATASRDHPAAAVSAFFRDQLNRENAPLLGFESIQARGDDLLLLVSDAAQESRRRLEESRYWVALVAVDLRVLLAEKTTRPLWAIRYNMSSRGVAFDRALPQMTLAAAPFFGRDTDGLLERGPKDARGTVELGEAIIIDDDVDDGVDPPVESAPGERE